MKLVSQLKVQKKNLYQIKLQETIKRLQIINLNHHVLGTQRTQAKISSYEEEF